jgi:hypothetical protein
MTKKGALRMTKRGAMNDRAVAKETLLLTGDPSLPLKDDSMAVVLRERSDRRISAVKFR